MEADGYGVSDLLYTFNQEVEKIDPKAIARYLQAVLRREDILQEVRAIIFPLGKDCCVLEALTCRAVPPVHYFTR